MKKLAALTMLYLLSLNVFAQNAIAQNPSSDMPKQNFWTPQNLWLLIISVLLTGFILLVVYALSRAAISLASQVEENNA